MTAIDLRKFIFPFVLMLLSVCIAFGQNGPSSPPIYTNISDGAVTTGKIVDGAVIESKLATDAVTTGKIVDGAVIESKLATDAVTTGKIVDGAVIESKLATDAVTTNKILDRSVTLPKIEQPHADNIASIPDLMGYAGYMPANVYGVEINLATPSAPTFTRLAGAVGKTPGADFNGINAFGGRRRCNLSDAGAVNKYYGEAGYTEDGSNGQVMVEQPRFYYKVVPLVTVPIGNGIGSHVIRARYYVSDSMLDGFKLHPAFIKDGLERPKIYLSAYEGSIYQTATAAYLLNDEQVASFTVDKLCSIAGAKPASGLTQLLTRANSRTLAANRGAKWSLATVQSVSASQLLFLVEYASFNTQTAIGRGVCDKTDDGATNMSNVTGATTALGNGSGAAVGTNGLVSIAYRGEENFWGNIWKWVDGLNIQASSLHYAWIADKNFADDTTTGYTNVGFTLAKASGYVSAFGYSRDFDWLFLPSAVAGSDANPVGDYFYQNNTYAGFLVALLGGSWYNGSTTGGCCWNLDIASSTRNRLIGARSLHVP